MRYRLELSLLISAVTWALAYLYVPWPAGNPALQLIRLEAGGTYSVLEGMYLVLWITTPFVLSQWLFKTLDRGLTGKREKVQAYVEPESRDKLYVVLGQVDGQPLVIPELGLYTGMAAIGSTGSGKTTSFMEPVVSQLLNWKRDDPRARCGGFVLEVKGDFCKKVREILKDAGREDDYVEIGPRSRWKYNPLNSSLNPDEMAFGIGAFIEQVYGKSREPFWRQAYTGAIKQVLKLLFLVDGYATLRDVYRMLVSDELLTAKLAEAESSISGKVFYLFSKEAYKGRGTTLGGYGAKRCDEYEGYGYKAPWSKGLEYYCKVKKPTPFKEVRIGGSQAQEPNEILESIQFKLKNLWWELDAKIRTDIVISCSETLEMFDDPKTRRLFCPEKDSEHVMPQFPELIEAGKVIAVNFPSATNAHLSRLIGIMAKLDYQRSVQARMDLGIHGRPTAFICDEYQFFVSIGENDPVGDDKFFSVSRQARCIPIVATQSISSIEAAIGPHWQAVMQVFGTKLFLRLSCAMSAEYAEKLCGREHRWRQTYNLGQSGKPSWSELKRQGVSMGTNHQLVLEPRFSVKDFTELASGEAVALVFDGHRSYPPVRVHLNRMEQTEPEVLEVVH